MEKRSERWDETYAGYESMWRSYLKAMAVLVGVSITSAIGLAVLRFRPDWLEWFFLSILILGLFCIIIHFQTMLGYKKEHSYWWMNRPYKWWK